ncbi:MAG: hypothetical protein Tsb0027_05510 [Wenzhouxiangellaceae bacterium]
MHTGKLDSTLKPRPDRRWFDYLGIGLSLACLIHCLALPLLIMFTPFVASWLLEDEFFHTYLLAFILPVALSAFAIGWLRHRSLVVLACGSVGLSLISIAALQAAWLDHSLFSASMEKILTSIGGFMLIVGHLLNLRWR